MTPLDELRLRVQELALGNRGVPAPATPTFGPVGVPGLPGGPPVTPPASNMGFPVPANYQELSDAYFNGTGQVPGLPSRGNPDNVDLNDPEAIATSRLQGTLDRQRARAGSLGVEVPEEKPSVVNRIFDVLSRGQYASAEAMDRLVQGVKEDGFDLGDLAEAGKGAVGGVLGKHKTSYNDVLRDVDNPVARGVLGFAGDVFLDPTTYIGAGLIKKASQEALEATGLKAADAVLNSKEVKESIAQRILSDHQRRLAEQIKPGHKGPKVGALSSAKLQKEVGKELRDEARKAYKVALDKAKDANEGAVTFKFAGKEVVRSVKLYEGGRKVSKAIKNIPVAGDIVSEINFKLRPMVQLGDVHELSRIHEGQSYANFHRNIKYWDQYVKDITEDDGILISHMIEKGRVNELPEELQDIASAAQTQLDDWWHDEVALGFHKDGKKQPNYVYHVYEASDAKVDEFYNARKRSYKQSKAAPGFTQQRELATLEEAKAAGLKPIEDIREIVRRRAAAHYQAVAHRSFMEDALTNFGFVIKTNADKSMKRAIEASRKFGKEFLDEDLVKAKYYGVEAYVPSKIKLVLDRIDTKDVKEITAIGKSLDKIQNALKAGYTVYRPGHHFRNLIGDIFLNWEDGVVNPNRYRHAARIVSANRHMPASEAWQALGKEKIKVGGRMVSLREVDDLYNQVGLKTGFIGTEISRKSNNKVGQIARNVAEYREDTARIAHFIDVLKKEGARYKNPSKEQLYEIAKEGARRVRKFNFDYGDLTKQEKGLRRWVMFYTFVRKNLPLQVEMLLTKPGKIATIPKSTSAIEEMLGTDTKSRRYEDQIPEWMIEGGNPQLGGNGNLISKLLGTDNEVFSTLQLPTSDLNRFTISPNGIANMLLSEVRPELRAVGELATGSQAFSGAPTPGAAMYTAQQLPFYHYLRKVIESKKDNDSIVNRQSIIATINELTGAGIQEATQNRKQGELRRLQDPLQTLIADAKRKNREGVKKWEPKAR